MRYIFICLVVFVLAVEVAFPVGAAPQPEYDKIEALLARIEGNLKQAAGVISVAKAKSAEMVEAKVQEKADLKEAVVAAEKKSEMFAAKMIANGMDTAIEEIKMTGPAYDAYLNYVEEGGKEEFDYFRMYLWQQK